MRAILKAFILTIFMFGYGSTVFSQDSIVLIANLQMGNIPIHDVWGYTDSNTGKKYALLGASTSGLRVVDLTDLANPVLVGTLSGGGVQAIDIKVWKKYAYVVGESGSVTGKIIDLSDPSNPVVVGTFPAAHNIFITDAGYMYLSAPGVRIMNLNPDPINPVQTFFDNSCNGHDISVIGNRLFDFAWECGTRIFDITQPDTLVQISLVPASGMKHHSGWTTEDGNYLFVCDEVASPTQNDITSWDITDMQNPILVDNFLDANAYVHNVYIKNDFAFVSYYRAGFRVFNVSDPTNFSLVAEYDTDTLLSGPGYGGNFGLFTNWGADSILASDEENGLFIFSFSSISTGIFETKKTAKFKVYPNPVNNILTIELNRNISNTGMVKIFTSTGFLVDEIQVTSKMFFDTKKLNAGMYYILITTESGVESKSFTVIK